MVKLIRYIQETPKLWSNQIHGIMEVKQKDKVYYYETLERPYKENRKETSCIKKGVYKFEIINKGTAFPFIQLYTTGRVDNRIQVFRESPVWFGHEKVFNIDTGMYEFTDFRECLNELCSLDVSVMSISEHETKNAIHPHAPITTRTYFKPSDDELDIIQTSRPNYTD